MLPPKALTHSRGGHLLGHRRPPITSIYVLVINNPRLEPNQERKRGSLAPDHGGRVRDIVKLLTVGRRKS